MNTQIYDQAAEWFIEFRTGELDLSARRRFHAWLRTSPEHVRAYLELAAIWNEGEALDPDREFSELDTAAENKVVTLASGARVESEKTKGQTPLQLSPADVSLEEPPLRHMPIVSHPAAQHNGYGFLAIAATVLLAVGATWFWTQRGMYETATGEQRTIALNDGSTVQLNARSKIRVRYTDGERSVDLLEGQALFKVAKDESRPFVVDSNGTQIRAVGTQFDVYKRNSGTTVTVVEGRVAVSVPDTPIAAAPTSASNKRGRGLAISNAVSLGAGEQLIVLTKRTAMPVLTDGGASITTSRPENSGGLRTQTFVHPVDVDAATAWTQQRFVFSFTPLSEVVEQFNRYNHRRLIIDDLALETLLINGNFSSTDPLLLLHFLQEQPGVNVTQTDAEIHISRQKG